MIKATYQDKDRVVDILTESFDDNQSVNYIVKQDKKRKQRIRKLMAYSFDICYLYGEVFLTNDKSGCALILFPDKKKNNLKSIFLDIKLVVSCIGISNIKKAMVRESKIKELQPKKLMYYLWFIGVDQDQQNKGIGSALIKEVIEDAFPGDVVGLFDTGNFKIGDTITEGEDFFYTGIPSFSPEIFKEVVNKDPLKTKQLEKGLLQLTDEGVAQLFTQFGGNKKIIGCVGELQFEVIQYRLLHEYGASVQMNNLPFYKACWLTSKDPKKLDEFTKYKQANIALDKDGHLVYLAQSEWFLNTEIQNNPDIEFHFSSEIHK